MSTDLFGQPILEATLPQPTCAKPKRNETPRGYAAAPGTGPVGEFCRTCDHMTWHEMSKKYFKCNLMKAYHTGGPKTDIRLKSPACKHWKKREEGEGLT